MRKKIKEKVTRFLLKRWLKASGFEQSFDGFLWRGDAIVYHKVTGRYSNEYPKELIDQSNEKNPA